MCPIDTAGCSSQPPFVQCTAGRASSIMGRSVFRTGRSKVGLPAAEHGMRTEEPTRGPFRSFLITK